MWALTRQLLESIKAKETNDSASAAPCVIVCGDFNSNLENSCGKLLVDGAIPTNHNKTKRDLNGFHWDRKKRRDTNITPTTDDDFPSLSVPIGFPAMHSAFEADPPTITHLVEGFEGNLDHIVVSASFRTLRSCKNPSIEILSAQTAMPSENFPSDHISLVCDLEVV